VDAARVVELMASARTLLIPGVEDFGITALEAMACGTPVVSIAEGGVSESVIDGRTGVLFRSPTPAGLTDAIARARSVSWDREEIRKRAHSFSRRRFQEEFRTLVEGVLASGGHSDAMTGERLDG
ncbi:MAG: glycosyltransferase, partial [Thermoanaerobaculia bacterium]